MMNMMVHFSSPHLASATGAPSPAAIQGRPPTARPSHMHSRLHFSSLYLVSATGAPSPAAIQGRPPTACSFHMHSWLHCSLCACVLVPTHVFPVAPTAVFGCQLMAAGWGCGSGRFPLLPPPLCKRQGQPALSVQSKQKNGGAHGEKQMDMSHSS